MTSSSGNIYGTTPHEGLLQFSKEDGSRADLFEFEQNGMLGCNALAVTEPANSKREDEILEGRTSSILGSLPVGLVEQ